MGNVNSISTEQRLPALGEDSLGNPFKGSVTVISLKLLSEIHASSVWLFHPLLILPAQYPFPLLLQSLFRTFPLAFHGAGLYPSMGIYTFWVLWATGISHCQSTAGQLKQSVPQEGDISKPHTSCPCTDLGTWSNLGTELVAQQCVQTGRLLLPLWYHMKCFS